MSFGLNTACSKEVAAGSVIAIDNATFYKKSVLPDLAKTKNCHVFYLPPYSPDLNPIEKKWVWLKRGCAKSCLIMILLSMPCQLVFKVV
ncbi:MAG TPA: hypothetical protein DEQ02_04945 [Ruminococcaceae bacterium]|nr:hypothetical protein [Oscillospiraceae bacterium]